MTGQSRALADALKTRCINIACIKETKWTGAKARDIGDSFKPFYNGKKAQNVVGIVVNQALRDNVVEVTRSLDWPMSLKIDTGAVVLRVVSCYASRRTALTFLTKEEFWESLDTHLQSLGSEEYIVIGGDLNGHVGQDRNGYERNRGGQGYGNWNEDGEWALECTEALKMKKLQHLVTYSSGRRETQIDYLLIRRQHLKLVTDVKVISLTNIGPQHRQMRTTTNEKIKWWQMPESNRDLVVALGAATPDIDPKEPVEALWNNIANHIRGAATNVLGKTKPGKRFIDKQIWWWNPEVQNVSAKEVAPIQRR